MRVVYRSQNDGDFAEMSDACAVVPVGESLTVQSMAEDADINVLMHRFGITGKFPESLRMPEYGDYSEITDFRGALEAVRDAEKEFMKIPARARAVFDNDPQKFLAFVSDGGSMEQLKQMAAYVPPGGSNVSSGPVQQVNSNAGGASGAPEGSVAGDGAPARAGS